MASWISPEVRSNDVELIQRDGLWAGDDYLGSRSITITIRCVGTSEDDLSNKVAILRRAFSSARSEEPLYFAIPGIADGAPSKIMGRTRKFESVTDLKYGRLNATFDIQFECTDPYIYPLDGFGVRRHIYRGKNFHEGGAACPSTSQAMACGFRMTVAVKAPRLVNATTAVPRLPL